MMRRKVPSFLNILPLFILNPIVWFWHKGDVNEWLAVKPKEKFKMREGEWGWLRARISIPEKVEGKDSRGQPIALFISTGEGGEIYVDGKLQSRYDNDHPGAALLTRRAIPGENHTVEIKVFGPVAGEKEVGFDQADLKILPQKKVELPCKIFVKTNKIVGELPRPLAGLSQGGGMPDYSVETAKALSLLHPRFFRMDNILTSVVKEKNNELVYDWSDFDKRVDFIFETGAEPILCLSYMPIPFDAIPDPDRHSAPKSYSLWEELCYRAAKRCIERGKRVKYWEVWNEANAGWLKPPPGENPLEAYLKLYEASVKGIKRADPKALIGGPCNASGPWDYSEERPYCVNGETFMEGLIAFCAKKNLPLDFITWHEYFHPPIVYREEVEKTKTILNKYPGVRSKVKGFFITEFNYAWWQDFSQDNEIGASWVANNVIRAAIPAGISALCYFYAKDGDNRFRGSWGLLLGDNRPKPSYFVYQLFSMMEDKRLEIEGGDEDICAIAAMDKKGDRITIMVVHFPERYGIPRRVNISISPLRRNFWGGESKLYLVDSVNNNLFHNPSVRGLECTAKGEIPKGNSWTINLYLCPYSVAFIELLAPKERWQKKPKTPYR
ncbi:MAG: GH39 family glycosyl hydrolase [bacterium]